MEVHEGSRITLRPPDGLNEEDFLLVPEDRYDHLVAAEEELEDIAEELGIELDHSGVSIGKWSQGHVHHRLEEALGDGVPGAYEDLADLLDNWSDHIIVELPEGTYVAIDENFEGEDPTPTVRISDELKDVLDRIHEEED